MTTTTDTSENNNIISFTLTSKKAVNYFEEKFHDFSKEEIEFILEIGASAVEFNRNHTTKHDPKIIELTAALAKEKEFGAKMWQEFEKNMKSAIDERMKMVEQVNAFHLNSLQREHDKDFGRIETVVNNANQLSHQISTIIANVASTATAAANAAAAASVVVPPPSNSNQVSMVEKGNAGEDVFAEIAAKAFRDFEGFELIDTHKQSHKGDRHLVFKDFTVMCDSKKYSNGVNALSREKIRADLKRQQHIPFAWMISLDTKIDKFGRAPFMFDWISRDQCVCYINSLLSFERPEEILRAVWFTCREFHQINQSLEKETAEMVEWKSNQVQIVERVEKSRKRLRELKTNINQLKLCADHLEEDICSILNFAANEQQNALHSVLKWWTTWAKASHPEETLSTKTAWNHYKKYGATAVDGDQKLDNIQSFKEYLHSIIGVPMNENKTQIIGFNLPTVKNVAAASTTPNGLYIATERIDANR